MSSINPSLPAKVFKFTPRTFYVNKFELSDNTSPHLILIKTKFNDSINLQGPPPSKSVRFYTIPTPATIKSNFNKYSKKRHQCIGRIIYFFFELLFVIYSVSVFIDAPELCRERFPHCTATMLEILSIGSFLDLISSHLSISPGDLLLGSTVNQSFSLPLSSYKMASKKSVSAEYLKGY